jgi:hypothetical protein
MALGDRISASVADVRAHVRRLVQLNVELFRAEMQKKGKQYAAAVGLLVGAAVLALYGLGFLLATISAALDIVLPLWLSLLIVTLALFIIVAILIAVGRSKLRQAKTPPAQSAMGEVQNTVGQLRTGVKKTLDSVSVGARQEQGTAGTSSGAPAPQASPTSSMPPPGSSPGEDFR